jgi:Cu(I)/Ag(I) efflux system membrane fusion protein
MKRSFTSLIVAATIGSLLTIAIYTQLSPSVPSRGAVEKSTEQKPLYWVAPMDPDYRQENPGKSPMGMDLVPVYPDGQLNDIDEGPGTVRISPAVINNIGVRTTRVKLQALNTQISTVGYVAYDEDKLVHLHPRVEGWIDKLYVKSVGNPVIKGQAIYDLYSPELVNAQEELLLAIDRKNTRLIEAATNRLIALQLPMKSIEALKKTGKVKQNITFYAPQNGVIENLYIREGFFVKPGTMLLSIADLSEIWVNAEVFERQASLVKKDTPVTMTLDYLPGKTWQGQVDFIYPTLEVKTRTVKVRLRFKNELGEFKPNMFAQVIIHTGTDDNSLLIPKEALIRTGHQDRVVLALGDGYFKSIAVTVGSFDSEHAQILSGLSAGDEIVSSAQFLLDSESSKSSDFKRMSFERPAKIKDTMDMGVPSQVNEISSASVSGTINSIMLNHGMVNISRGPIEKWQREAATLDFIFDEKLSQDDLASLRQGSVVEFTFEIHDGEFIITKIQDMSVMTDHSHH